MRIKLVSLLCLLASCGLTICAQSAKSDSLFTSGIKLYNEGKFNEAIKLFSESQALDEEEIDPTSCRSDYSTMWISACHKKLGNIELADSIYPYNNDPVDRRLTIQSDSLSDLANKTEDEQEKLFYLRQCEKLEAKNLGRTHYFRANTLHQIAYYEALSLDYLSLKETIKELGYVAQHCRFWRIDDFVLWNAFNVLIDKGEDIEAVFDLMIKIIEPSKNDFFGTYYDGIYGHWISGKAEYLKSKENYVELYEFCKHEYEELKKSGIYNSNLHAAISIYAQSAFSLFLVEKDEATRQELNSIRSKLYPELIDLSEKLYGKNSCEYAQSLSKMGSFYSGAGLDINEELGKDYLHRCFDILLNPDLWLLNTDKLNETIKRSKNVFENIGDTESYYHYLILLATTVPSNKDNSVILGEIAEHYKDEGKYGEAIKTYDRLYSIHEKKASIEGCINTSKEIAECHKLMKDYEKAIDEYQKYDSLFCLSTSHRISESYFFASNLMDLAECYLSIGDTLNFYNVSERKNVIKEECLESIIKNDALLGESQIMRDRLKIEMFYYYGVDCYEYDKQLAVFNDKYSGKSEKAKKYIKLAEIINLESSLPREEKQDNTIRHFQCLGEIYTWELNFDSAYYYINKVIESCDFSKFGRHITAYSQMAKLYSMVSIEPEISLDYNSKSVSILTNMIINNFNSIPQLAIKPLYELLTHEWLICSEQSEYLGDYDKKFNCYEDLLLLIEKIDGCDTQSYVEKKIDLFEEKASYNHWIMHNQKQSRALCDSIKSLFEDNQNLFIDNQFINYSRIGRDYLYYCNDTLAAEFYLQKHEDEIIRMHPCNYERNKEYIEIQEFRARDLHGGQDNIQYSDVAALYRSVPELKEEYIEFLYWMAVETNNLLERRNSLEEILNLNPNKKIYTMLISTYLQLKEYDKILPIYKIAIEKERENLFEQFASGSENDREYYWSGVFENPFTLAEPLYTMFPGKVSSSIIYDNLLIRKNLLLNSSISAINFIKSEGDSLLIAKYNRTLDLKESLQASKSDSIVNNGRIISRHLADSLVKRFEKEIMERAAIIGDYTKGLNIRWQDVQNKLSNDDIAIEFTRYKSFDGSATYAATLLKNEGVPIFVPLCEETEILNQKKNAYLTTSMSKLLWEPIKRYLKDVKNIFFSPDGQLYNVAIESMPYWDDVNCLMSQKWNMYRLSSTKELAITKEKNDNIMATIYGGIKYDVGVDVLLADSKRYPHNRSLDFQTNLIGDSIGLRKGVEYLPASKIEAEEICKILAKKIEEPRLLTEAIGTEASFKDLSGRKMSLIHIATHGFYWSKTEASFRADLGFLELNDNRNRVTEDKALTRSGLLFAGANNVLTGEQIPKNVDDGILTAKEISHLDLRGLDLIVLSACQTGLGEITSDGVLGLQRGFKKAGAGSLLMSLWNVNDNATKLLMTQFYNNLANGMSKNDALHQAQYYLRDYEEEVEMESEISPSVSAYAKEQAEQVSNKIKGKKKKMIKKYNDPKYWAAFILLDAIN